MKVLALLQDGMREETCRQFYCQAWIGASCRMHSCADITRHNVPALRGSAANM